MGRSKKTETQSQKPQNLKITNRGKGMGWPVGAIIPSHALPNNGVQHLEIGAVEQTEYPVTHETAISAEKPASDTSALIENERLRGEVANLEGLVAKLKDSEKSLQNKVAELAEENAALEKLLEEASQVKNIKDHQNEQNRLNQA